MAETKVEMVEMPGEPPNFLMAFAASSGNTALIRVSTIGNKTVADVAWRGTASRDDMSAADRAVDTAVQQLGFASAVRMSQWFDTEEERNTKYRDWMGGGKG